MVSGVYLWKCARKQLLTHSQLTEKSSRSSPVSWLKCHTWPNVRWMCRLWTLSCLAAHTNMLTLLHIFTGYFQSGGNLTSIPQGVQRWQQGLMDLQSEVTVSLCLTSSHAHIISSCLITENRYSRTGGYFVPWNCPFGTVYRLSYEHRHYHVSSSALESFLAGHNMQVWVLNFCKLKTYHLIVLSTVDFDRSLSIKPVNQSLQSVLFCREMTWM